MHTSSGVVLTALALQLTLLLGGCQPSSSSPSPPTPEKQPLVTLLGKTMGTTYSVKIKGATLGAKQRVDLQSQIDAVLERVNDQMSTYRPKSELSRFNQHQSSEPFTVSQQTADVVSLALQVGAQTNGSFDVTLGPVIDLWGFDKSGRKSAPPSPADLAAARARQGISKLHVQGRSLTKDRPDLDVNLSGIAKGHGVDVVASLLSGRAFTDFMVEIGGEVRARGTNASGTPWRIGINTPRSAEDPTSIVTAVPLVDQAMATSGDYRNFFESGGVRYSHIIDARTAAPVRHDLVSVTVLGKRCAEVDAFATAFLAMDEPEARGVLSDLPGIEALFIHVDRKDGALKITRTKGFPN